MAYCAYGVKVMTPSKRPGAFETNDHHMFWKAKDYRTFTKESNRLRNYGAFIIPVVRWKHDMLHQRVQPLIVPERRVCNTVYEIALETQNPVQLQRISMIAAQVALDASFEPRPERADQLMEVALHLQGQKGIIEC